MNRHKRYIALIPILLTLFVAYADPGKKINDIKKDLSFLYGDATKPTISEAYDAALNKLQSNIQDWYESKDSKNTGKTIRNLTFLADTINSMRGNFYRVFAYVSIHKVEETLIKDMEQVASTRNSSQSETRKSDVTILDSNPKTDSLLRIFISKSNINDFEKQIVESSKQGIVTKASKDITLKPTDSYLAVFNKTKKGQPLLHLLPPGQGQLVDLLTGQPVDIDFIKHNRETYRILWFVLSYQ